MVTRVHLRRPGAEGVEAAEEAIRAGRRAPGHADLHREHEPSRATRSSRT